jgi:hypothetical protein
VPAPTLPDIDRILQAIRTEAHARGAASRAMPHATGGAASSHGLPQPELRHAADFLALPLDVFLHAAYRHVLGRDPDAAGSAHYQRALLAGRLTRIELLGRLRLSPEGRRRGMRLPGLDIAFPLALAYRIPVAGPLLALVARLLRLPAHWQDRSGIEVAALASGAWMKR